MAQKLNATWNNKFVRALRADPKKAGVLTILVTVLVVMWVRMATKHSDNPANAATHASYAVSDNRPHAVGDDSTGSNDQWLHGAIKPLSRNLFAVKLDNFPLDVAATGTPVPDLGDGFWDQLAKSSSLRADQKKERQALLDNVQQQASQLRLQSIVMGAKPRAVINGEMVGEGDVVASGSGDARTVFRVLKIESRRIILEREGIKLEMKMN